MDKSALTPTDNVVINIYGDLKKQEEDTFKDLTLALLVRTKNNILTTIINY